MDKKTKDSRKRVFISDQGGQYATPKYTALFPKTTQISMSAVGRPMENGIVERFMRTFKEEHIDYTEYNDFTDAITQIAYWMEVEYMTKRIHSALDYLTPAEFESQAALEETNPLLINA